MTCIKTGAIVFFPEYNTTVPCDLHSVGDAIVVKFSPEHFYFHEGKTRTVTHVVAIAQTGFLDKKAGIAVVPSKQLGEIKC